MRKLACIIAVAVSVVASADHCAWPQSAVTIKIVVPYPAGGVADTLARLLAEQIGRTQGPMLIVENRPGVFVVLPGQVGDGHAMSAKSQLLSAKLHGSVRTAASVSGNIGTARLT